MWRERGSSITPYEFLCHKDIIYDTSPSNKSTLIITNDAWQKFFNHFHRYLYNAFIKHRTTRNKSILTDFTRILKLRNKSNNCGVEGWMEIPCLEKEQNSFCRHPHFIRATCFIFNICWASGPWMARFGLDLKPLPLCYLFIITESLSHFVLMIMFCTQISLIDTSYLFSHF